MNYKQKWEWIKEYLEQAIDEGCQHGFDKEQGTFENGAFYAYNRLFEEVKRKEGDKNED